MKHTHCVVGRHDWQHHVSKELGGPGAGHDLRSRRGAETRVYGKPPSKGVVGSGGCQLPMENISCADLSHSCLLNSSRRLAAV